MLILPFYLTHMIIHICYLPKYSKISFYFIGTDELMSAFLNLVLSILNDTKRMETLEVMKSLRNISADINHN